MTDRKKPVLRKEVVETASWGDVVVRQLTMSQRLQLNVPTDESVKQRDGESEAEHQLRLRADWAAFQNKLLELSVGEPGENDMDPLFTAHEWDIFQGDPSDQIVADAMKVADKARAMNGFRLTNGEDPAKNA
jgi:hypothetical protein